MNERIKELSELADDKADEILQMKGEFHPDWHDVRDEIFVRLILEDVIGIYNDDGHQTEYEQDMKVLTHFGME